MIHVLTAEPLPYSEHAPLVAMVSGGSDSTALLVKAARGELCWEEDGELRRADPGRVCVLHVNHCLRGADSEGDEGFVRRLCAELGVACCVSRVDVARLLREKGGNLEEVARERRYAEAWGLLEELAREAGAEPAAGRVLVAHTADDRLETFLMRVVSGAGTTGLAGLRRRRGLVVRPLLGETRAGLRAYLGGQGVAWREDATNAETAALRSYVRNLVVPVLERRNPALPRTLSRELDVLSDEDALLEKLAADALARLRVASAPGTVALDAGALACEDVAIARRAVRRALKELLGDGRFREGRFEARHVEVVLALARSRAGSCTLPLGTDVRYDRGNIVLASRLPGGPHVPDDASLAVPGQVEWGGAIVGASLVCVPRGADVAAFARERARLLAAEGAGREGRDFVLADARAAGLEGDGGVLCVGAARAGERMAPFGLGREKSLADVLADAGVPRTQRPWVPVVRPSDPSSNAPVVWVAGNRLDGRAAYHADSRVLLQLTVTFL